MATWLEKLPPEVDDYNDCPKVIFKENNLYKPKAPGCEYKTAIRHKRGNYIIGCRGLTCEQCWNQESEE